ncbi:polysaccharide deacetylase family protein [Methylomusa anaerophila]|nr:polysaccharide deacetylase family protein [Methylomusa anaerophila]
MHKKLLCGLLLVIAGGIWYYFGLVQEMAKGQNPAGASVSQTPANALPKAGPDKAVALPAGIPVLMYHSISNEPDNDAVISPKLFKEQMQFLYKNQYTPISLDQLYSYLNGGRDLPAKPVVITFDDGYRDTYEIAYPVLKQYGFISVLFIPASEIGQRLSAAELAEMKAAGMEIASHSYTHRDLSTLSRQEQLAEIVKSKEVLDRLLSQDTRHFCYPYSGYDPATLEILKEKGFKLAVTTTPGWARPGDDFLLIKRIWMGNSVDLSRFEERLTRENYSIL